MPDLFLSPALPINIIFVYLLFKFTLALYLEHVIYYFFIILSVLCYLSFGSDFLPCFCLQVFNGLGARASTWIVLLLMASIL